MERPYKNAFRGLNPPQKKTWCEIVCNDLNIKPQLSVETEDKGGSYEFLWLDKVHYTLSNYEVPEHLKVSNELSYSGYKMHFLSTASNKL